MLFRRYPEPFTAHFLAGSDPEFFVLPQAGELLPEGTVGTHITVGFKPRMYGKKHTATLVIQVSPPECNRQMCLQEWKEKKKSYTEKAALEHTNACTVIILLLFTMDKNKTKF